MEKIEIETEVLNHQRRNIELAEALSDHGRSTFDSILAEFHFWSDNQEDAISLVKELTKLGFTVMELSPLDDDGNVVWNVEVRKTDSVQTIISDAFTEQLVVLANESNSRYDGWGTSV